MTRDARTATGTGGRARLWGQWLSFEAAHPGAAIALSSLVVLLASAAVLATFALLPFPEGTT